MSRAKSLIDTLLDKAKGYKVQGRIDQGKKIKQIFPVFTAAGFIVGTFLKNKTKQNKTKKKKSLFQPNPPTPAMSL